MADVALRVGGRDFTDWESVTLDTRLDLPADTFDLGSPRLPGGIDIPANAPCEILEGGEIFLTGQVEKIGWAWATRNRTLAGRSKVGRVVSSSATPGTYPNMTLLQLAEALCAPFGLVVTSDDDDGIVLPTVTVEPGDTVQQVLEREARPRAWLWVSEPTGLLVMTRAGLRTAVDVLEPPDVEDMTLDVDTSERFAEIVVRGESVWDDANWGADAQAEASVGDPTVGGAQRLILTSEVPGNGDDARDRALWEHATRLAKSVSLKVTVPGWRQSNGERWAAGLLARARNGWMGLDLQMIVAGVTFRAGANVKPSATLDLKPLQAYLPMEPRLWARHSKSVRGPRGRKEPWIPEATEDGGEE